MYYLSLPYCTHLYMNVYVPFGADNSKLKLGYHNIKIKCSKIQYNTIQYKQAEQIKTSSSEQNIICRLK